MDAIERLPFRSPPLRVHWINAAPCGSRATKVAGPFELPPHAAAKKRRAPAVAAAIRARTGLNVRRVYEHVYRYPVAEDKSVRGREPQLPRPLRGADVAAYTFASSSGFMKSAW